MNGISCSIYEVTSHVLIPSLVQLVKAVLDNIVSCEVRQTSSVMQVLSDAVLHTDVRDACVQVDIHDLLAYDLPDTFLCFHGVLVPSVIDEMVIEQFEVKSEGQGQVSDGNILVSRGRPKFGFGAKSWQMASFGIVSVSAEGRKLSFGFLSV